MSHQTFLFHFVGNWSYIVRVFIAIKLSNSAFWMCCWVWYWTSWRLLWLVWLLPPGYFLWPSIKRLLWLGHSSTIREKRCVCVVIDSTKPGNRKGGTEVTLAEVTSAGSTGACRSSTCTCCDTTGRWRRESGGNVKPSVTSSGSGMPTVWISSPSANPMRYASWFRVNCSRVAQPDTPVH